MMRMAKVTNQHISSNLPKVTLDSSDTKLRVTSEVQNKSVNKESSGSGRKILNNICSSCTTMSDQSSKINSTVNSEYLHIVSAPAVSNEDILWGYEFIPWEKCPQTYNDRQTSPVPVSCGLCCLDRQSTLVKLAAGQEKIKESKMGKANKSRAAVQHGNSQSELWS